MMNRMCVCVKSALFKLAKPPKPRVLKQDTAALKLNLVYVNIAGPCWTRRDFKPYADDVTSESSDRKLGEAGYQGAAAPGSRRNGRPGKQSVIRNGPVVLGHRGHAFL